MGGCQYLVYNRLVKDLEVPFQLDSEAVRKEETHVHEALREALVNTLIHADYMSSRPLKIIKHPNHFVFSNPGRLRIPIPSLYEGGVSDPRNPQLQKMFQMLGLGEKAGSGFQKILRAWKEQQWRDPSVNEDTKQELTTVTLEMVSMIPKNVETEFKKVVGNQYSKLTQLEKTILMLAQQSEKISNTQIQKYTSEHSTEIGKCFKSLVKNGYLEKRGRSSGTHYILANHISSEHFETSSEHYDISSEHYDISSEHYDTRDQLSGTRDQHSAISSEHYDTSSEHYEHLRQIAAPVRQKRRANKKLVQKVVRELCSEDYLSLRTLAQLLGREPDSIRNHYVNPMLSEGLLQLKYPQQPNHSQQAYIARSGRGRGKR